MFVPAEFAVTDLAEAADLVRRYPLGAIVSHSAGGGLLATHLPFELNSEDPGKWILISHIAKANPQSALLQDSQEVMVIFQGPNTYISASWYGHQNVSTWNYQAVHLHGRIRRHSDQELWQSLHRLMAHHEKDQACPVRMRDLPVSLLESYFPDIIGFEIAIDKIEAAFKLSQNRNETDHAAIIAELDASTHAGAAGIAEAMKKQKV